MHTYRLQLRSSFSERTSSIRSKRDCGILSGPLVGLHDIILQGVDVAIRGRT